MLAIAEACLRPNLHFVPIKSVAQQDLQLCVRMRTRHVLARVAIANQLRSFLAEYGVIIAKSLKNLRAGMPALQEHDLLTPTARRVCAELNAELLALDDKIAQADRVLVEALARHPAYPRLQAVPGIGPVVAASLLATVGNAQQFCNGR